MKQKKTVRLTYEFEFEFDPESEAFKDTLESYKDVINSGAGEEEVLISAAVNILQRGVSDMIEGVGYVKRKGQSWSPNNDQFSGIWVTDDEPFPETEVN